LTELENKFLGFRTVANALQKSCNSKCISVFRGRGISNAFLCCDMQQLQTKTVQFLAHPVFVIIA